MIRESEVLPSRNGHLPFETRKYSSNCLDPEINNPGMTCQKLFARRQDPQVGFVPQRRFSFPSATDTGLPSFVFD
jgi:hypothetical protein